MSLPIWKWRIDGRSWKTLSLSTVCVRRLSWFAFRNRKGHPIVRNFYQEKVLSNDMLQKIWRHSTNILVSNMPSYWLFTCLKLRWGVKQDWSAFYFLCFKGLAQIIQIKLFVKTTKLILKELNLDSGSVTMLLFFCLRNYPWFFSVNMK